MKYFIDVQYHSYEKKTGTIFNVPSSTVTEVISVGIVTEKGDSLYLINKDFDLDMAWNDYRIREGVLKPMYCKWRVVQIDFFGIDKKDIALLVREEGVPFGDIGIDMKMFLNDGHVSKEFYFLDNGAWSVFCNIIGGVQISYRRLNVDDIIKGFARDIAYSHLIELLGLEAIQVKSTDKYATLISHTNYPTRDVLKKTALTEAKLCKERYEYIETLKREHMENRVKNAERIQKELDHITGRINKKPKEPKVADGFLNPADNSVLLTIEKGIKKILEGYLRGEMNERVAMNFISDAYGIKRDRMLTFVFEGFKCSGKLKHDIESYASILMQMTEEFLKRKADEKESLDFIAKCKAGMGCYVGGTDPYKKDSKVNIAEQRLGKAEYDFFMSKMYESVTPPPASKVEYRFSVFSWGDIKPKLATREECDAPSRPKIELESTISREEQELMSEIMEKNKGRFVIVLKSFNRKEAEVTVSKTVNGSPIFSVYGERLKAMSEVLDFLNGKCMSLFCYQFEAVTNVNFRKRCVECGMEYDIKIKE